MSSRLYKYDNFDGVTGVELENEYYCVGFNTPIVSQVEVCKMDDHDNYKEGWQMALVAEDPIQESTLINIEDDSGTDSIYLDEGYYVVVVSGTYRYGTEVMIADAGYSKRPNGEWLSGFDLPSGKGFMALIDGETVYWGPRNEGHEYTTIHYHEGGEINISMG